MRSTRMILSLLLVMGAAATASDKKLTLDELIARHLSSIGTPEARAAVKTRVAEGKSQYFEVINPGFALEGKISIVSEADNVRLVLKYMNPTYFGEDIITRGDKVMVYGHLDRSPLGYFLYYRSTVVLTDGLLEGTLSTAWPLLDSKLRSARLTYSGLTRINGELLHEIRFQPKKRTDLDIRLYLNKDDYRHVLTIVKYTINPRLVTRAPDMIVLGDGSVIPGFGNIPSNSPDAYNSSQHPVRYSLVQRFSNFKEFDGLTLPTTYEIQFDSEHGVVRHARRYINTFTKIMNNVPLDPKNFEFR